MIRVDKKPEAVVLLLPHTAPCDGAGHKIPGFVMLTSEGLVGNKISHRDSTWRLTTCPFYQNFPNDFDLVTAVQFV